VSEGKKQWKISGDQIREWLELEQTSSGVGVGLNQEKVEEYLKTFAGEINAPPQNAKFKVENGVVKEFQLHQGGKELNLEASYQAINNYVLNFDTDKISSKCLQNPPPEEIVQLVVTITAPQIPIGSLNNLGIKELVGVGESDFSGSPVNRRHNIKTGATKLNGTLIAPGEEFSTNKALGEITGATGYLPELVIKGDKTIPEYGGGLCQIGTTMFRVALNAGLPITERRPHSYRVVYYEPAGMDATIYGPKPDLKFTNDTPAYLLLQTRIEGDIVNFELWGTSDGRKVELTKPKIYNIVGSGPTKIVETEDLKPGEKKCTERAHAGADAEFDRSVTTASGEIKTETWKSHYVPWSAVCLVGKAPGAAPAPETGTPPADGSSAPPPDPALQNTNSPTTF
jgi:vancomycin resistance protein YoaR